MRCFLLLGFGLMSLAFAGCESMDSLPSRVRERFEAPEPRIRVYDAEQRAVFEAAQRAVKRIGFVVSRSGAAQGIIRAHSALRTTEAFGVARQVSIEVKIDSFDPGVTQVAVVVREQEESEAFAGATDIPVREHGLYESFFGGLDAEVGKVGREAYEPAK